MSTKQIEKIKAEPKPKIQNLIIDAHDDIIKIYESEAYKAKRKVIALGEPFKRKLLEYLSKKSLTVTDMYILMGCEQSIASQHLAILRKCGFVDTDRQGKFMWYSQNKEAIHEGKKLRVSLGGELKTSKVFRALAHALRLRILNFIHNSKGSVVEVNKIYRMLKLEQSITSLHLKVLRLADLVKTEKEGKFVFYRLNLDVLKKASEALREENRK